MQPSPHHPLNPSAQQDPDPMPLRARPEPYADDVRAAVDDAFAENEALRESMRPTDTYLDAEALWASIWNWFQELIRDIDGLRFTSPGLYWLLLAGLLVVLLALLVHIAWTFRRAWTRSAQYRAEQQVKVTEERIRRHADWLEEARRLAAGHSYREAVHALVVSLLALLDERNVLHVARSWTLREITDRVGRRSGEALEAGDLQRLAEYSRAVERATYAAEEPGHPEWLRLEADTVDLAQVLRHVPAEGGRGQVVRTAEAPA